MGTDLQYGRDIKRAARARTKRHPLNFLFDPLYPILLAGLVAPVVIWYFKIPVNDFFDFDIPRLIRKWFSWV